MGMIGAVQAASEGVWRMHLRDMRTLRTLQNGAPAEDEIRRMPDRVLRAAVQNPDHSEAARAVAEAELRARSITAERWRLVVPGFLRARDLEKGEGRLRSKWARGWSRGVASLAVTLPIPFAFSWHQPLARELAGGVVVFAVLFVTAWLLLIALRRYPVRVVLMRKLDQRHLSTPLDAAIRDDLIDYGHIIEFSDRYLPPTQLNQLTSGHGAVFNARDYRNLALRLGNRTALNVRAALSGKFALKVRCTQAWWKTTAHLLGDSSDVLLVDLSQIADGAPWELDLVQELGAERRTVFIALWGKLEEAEAALAARGIDAVVHHYAPDGESQRRPQFRAAMLGAMRATHQVSA
jgi:hypothetical protein